MDKDTLVSMVKNGELIAGLDLSGKDLTGADLSSGIFEKTSFAGAKLAGASLAESAGCAPSPPSTPTLEAVTVAPVSLPTSTALPVIDPTTTATPPTASIEEVIEYELRGSFNFFWEQANADVSSPGFGLIRDRFPGSEGIASMASVGFGLTAYVVGVDKGYITLAEGYERANKTMDTLLAMDREHGFYYHFVDMQTGKRAWESEVSSIDTSILLMGVLSAGQYFGSDVQAKAEQIYAEGGLALVRGCLARYVLHGISPRKGF